MQALARQALVIVSPRDLPGAPLTGQHLCLVAHRPHVHSLAQDDVTTIAAPDLAPEGSRDFQEVLAPSIDAVAHVVQQIFIEHPLGITFVELADLAR